MKARSHGGAQPEALRASAGFRPVTPTRNVRVAAILVMTISVWAIAQVVGESNFNRFYSNVLIFLAYLFTPWTAVNLVDCFFVRRGVYAIREIFNPRGIYGRWGWQGNAAYLLALAAMVPFFVTEPYTGPIAKALSDVDYSIFVGLPVAAILYLLFSRTIDLESERRIAFDEGLVEAVQR